MFGSNRVNKLEQQVEYLQKELAKSKAIHTELLNETDAARSKIEGLKAMLANLRSDFDQQISQLHSIVVGMSYKVKVTKKTPKKGKK